MLKGVGGRCNTLPMFFGEDGLENTCQYCKGAVSGAIFHVMLMWET